jgi:3-oxoadipate enol-lactonase
MRVAVDGVDLHLRVHGAGEPLLLIHGFPLSGRLWDEVVAELRDEFRLIVPDLRGHGSSQATREASMARYADDLAVVLDAARERRPVTLVGMSMGGYIAFEFLRRHPGRVRALALVSTRAQRDTPDVVQGRLDSAERAEREGSGAVAEGMVDRLFAPSAPAQLRRRWLKRMAATPPEGVVAALHAMAERRDSRPTLRRTDRPVLVVVGTEDVITPPSETRKMAEAARGARLRVIPGAGHMLPAERPVELAAALREFARALASEG